MLKLGRPFEPSPPDPALLSETTRARLRALAAAYTAVILHFSLRPYTGWRSPDAAAWDYWMSPKILPLPHFFPVDAFLNFMAYIPLGALALWCLPSKWRGFTWIGGGVWLACTGLSLSLELTQAFLPSRVSSKADLLFNSTGAAIGVLLACNTNRLPRWTR
jgi:glycopeptide antibiotics resistance protein